jgi:hypothetical protein
LFRGHWQRHQTFKAQLMGQLQQLIGTRRQREIPPLSVMQYFGLTTTGQVGGLLLQQPLALQFKEYQQDSKFK